MSSHQNKLTSRARSKTERAPRRALVSPRDPGLLALVLAGAPISAMVPARWLINVVRRCARLASPLPNRSADPRWIERVSGFKPDTARTIARRARAERYASVALFLRNCIRRPPYDTGVEGLWHVEAARREGKGAVLWVADFSHAGDVTKVALNGRGFPISHSIAAGHGLATSAFGAGLTQFAHAWFMRSIARLSARPQSDDTIVDAAIARLKQNEVVCMSAGGPGTRLYQTRLFNGKIDIPGDALLAAWQAKAPVLPVFVLPAPDAPEFQVMIDAPLALKGSGKNAVIAAAVADFATRLQSSLGASPHLWRDWSVIKPLELDDRPLSARIAKLTRLDPGSTAGSN